MPKKTNKKLQPKHGGVEPSKNGHHTVVAFKYEWRTRKIRAHEGGIDGPLVAAESGYRVDSVRHQRTFLNAVRRQRPKIDVAKVEAQLVELARQEDERQANPEPDDSDAAPDKPALKESARVGQYFVAGNATYRTQSIKDGTVDIQLTNFAAKIVKQITMDDGVERRSLLTLEGTLYNGTTLLPIEVPSSQFSSMNWPLDHWGSQVIIYAGFGAKDHTRVAIQMLSGNAELQSVYAHSGWRQIGGKWCYLHAGGAIGASSVIENIAVRLPPVLSRFVLPAPPQGEACRHAVRASLAMLKVGPLRITSPLYASIVRAVLDEADFSIHVVGRSGRHKSELAALAQQHFGPEMVKEKFPCTWLSTANANEAAAFSAKNALLVVDDYNPAGSMQERQRYQRNAEQLFRAQGNVTGRQRCYPDGTPRPEKHPRGLIVSTGEDLPPGQSLQARLFIIEEKSSIGNCPGDISREELILCQRDAADGLYAQAMSAFLQWLAPGYPQVIKERKSAVAEIRDETLKASRLHPRTHSVVGELTYAWKLWLDFVRECDAISQVEREVMEKECLDALIEAAQTQGTQQEANEATNQFLRLLAACLSSGAAHVTNLSGGAPEKPESWGWRKDNNGDVEPQQKRIGWLDDKGNLYLEPEVAFAELQKLAVSQGEALHVRQSTLWKRLKEQELLASHDGDNRSTTKLMVNNRRTRVIHLHAESLSASEDNERDGTRNLK